MTKKQYEKIAYDTFFKYKKNSYREVKELMLFDSAPTYDAKNRKEWARWLSGTEDGWNKAKIEYLKPYIIIFINDLLVLQKKYNILFHIMECCQGYAHINIDGISYSFYWKDFVV